VECEGEGVEKEERIQESRGLEEEMGEEL